MTARGAARSTRRSRAVRAALVASGLACAGEATTRQPAHVRAGSSTELELELACDGTTDATPALQRALDRGGRLVLPARRVCRFSTLIASTPITVDLAGSTLQVLGGARRGPFVRVLAGDTAFRGGTIDGAHALGPTGWLVDWHGGDGRLDDVVLQHGDSIGLSVTAPAARVVARRVVARRFTGPLGIGFRAGAGALITEDCGAEHNSYAGFFVSAAASSATVIDGWSRRNGAGAVLEGQRGGRLARLASFDDDRFGLLLDHGASDWHIERVEARATGRTARDRSGTGVELFARNRRNVLDEVVVVGAAGYGLAIAGDSDDNRFGRVELDARGAWDGDPGLVLAGGSDRNVIDSVRSSGHTIGVRFGDNDLAADVPSNDNHIGSVHVAGARYNAIRFEWGHRNVIRSATVADSDSSGSDAQGFKGVVYFGNDASGNRVLELVQADAVRVPNYLVYAGPCALASCLAGPVPASNRVDRVVARAWSLAITAAR